MDLRQYSECFMGEIWKYYQMLLKIKEWNPESDVISKQLVKLKEEFLCDENFSTLTADQFLENEWIKFQMILAHNYAKHFYNEDYIFGFDEFVNIKELLEAVLMDTVSDQSVYTRVVNKLGIPLEQIPKQYVQILFSSDEFMFATNYILKIIHDDIEDVKKYFNIDDFRAHVSTKADVVISGLAEKGYFGTYDREYLTELMIAYKLGVPLIGPLYITPKFPKNQNKYEDLKSYVNSIWDRFKSEESDTK